MRFAKARISTFVLAAAFCAASHSLGEGAHSGPSSRGPSITSDTGGPTIPLPKFDPDRVQMVTDELLEKYRTVHPKNWFELQRTSGSVMVNPTIPSKLPKFDPAKVNPAVEKLAQQIRAQEPQSWSELGKILNQFTGVIPASVMENIIAFQVLRKDDAENNEKELSKRDRGNKGGSGSSNDEKPLPERSDRINPTARDALDKNLDSNIGKFNSFLPPPTPYSPFGNLPSSGSRDGNGAPGSETGAGRGNGREGRGAREGSPVVNVFSTQPGQGFVPASSFGGTLPVMSQNAPSFPNFPDSVASPKAAPVETQPPKVALAQPFDPKPLTGVPPPVSPSMAPSTEVQKEALASILKANAGGSSLKTQKVAEKEKGRKARSVATRSGPGGSDAGGVAGEGPGWKSGEDGPGNWLRNLLAALWGGDESEEGALGNPSTEGLDGEGPVWNKQAGQWTALAGSLEGNASSRVIASVAEVTGVSKDTAERLYHAVLYSAWGSTLGLLGYLWRRRRARVLPQKSATENE